MTTDLGYYQVGDAIVALCKEPDGSYSGAIYVDPSYDPINGWVSVDMDTDTATWRFDGLHGPACGWHDERDLALAAAGFGGYYTTDNRGADLPDWVPAPEIADVICQATIWVDESGQVTELEESELPGWIKEQEQGIAHAC